MANPKSRCPHVSTARGTSLEDIHSIQNRRNLGCDSCGFDGPNLWLCLHSSCLFVGCGESATDHSSIHSQETRHPLTLNLTTRRIWCYGCETEVYISSNYPPFQLRCTPVSVSGADTDREWSLKSQPIEDSDSDLEDRSERPRGLAGLSNIGNTCYMNSAIQALSNCPPLTRFFIDCPGYVLPDKKLAKSYMKLMHEMWHKKRPNYVIPNAMANSIRQVHPMFRGYLQHDSQEFLRCLMDHLHEELKQPYMTGSHSQTGDSDSSDEDNGSFAPVSSVSDSLLFSDTDYETCDSGLSSEHSSVALSGANSAYTTIGGAAIELLGEQDLDLESPDTTQTLSEDAGPDGDREDMEKVSVKSVKDMTNLASQQQHTHDTATIIQQEDSSSIESNMASLESQLGEPDTIKQRSIPTTMPSSKKHSSSCSPDGYDRLGKNSPMTVAARSESTKRPQVCFRSIISDIFDGQILSSVQCMTCHRISCTNETFQDLSLPIPTKEHLALIHSSPVLVSGIGVPVQKGPCADQPKPQGWFAWMYGLIRQIPSWFWGPVIKLQDCLAAFFSADDLKGENMYSCEKCKKLRNGVKYSKVLKLPEVLCIHLKRFRHDCMYSLKIGSFVSFPVEGLDMGPYLHKDCKDQVTVYNLVACICHHGTAGGGHYTAYALNHRNETWYEFDDQTVTEVDIQQVENCEAYVLFYRKIDEQMISLRQKANQVTEMEENGFMKFYISRQWVNKFNTFAEPGPINNYDFLCRHGDVQPKKWSQVAELAMETPQILWEFLHTRFGGGPAVNHLSQCQPCLQEFERLKRRQQYEMETFLQLHKEFQCNSASTSVYALSMAWFRIWENFVRAKVDEPPGPIDNSKISISKGGTAVLIMNSDFAQMSESTWNFFHSIYGGGPELLLKQSGLHKVDETGDTKFLDATLRQSNN